MKPEVTINVYILIANIALFLSILMLVRKLTKKRMDKGNVKIKVEPIQKVKADIEITHLIEGEDNNYIDV